MFLKIYFTWGFFAQMWCIINTLSIEMNIYPHAFFALTNFSISYDHEGRLTNVTRPTGVVTSLHREMEKSITIDIENSNRDDDVTVITNLSSVEASYTVVQGTKAHFSAHLLTTHTT